MENRFPSVALETPGCSSGDSTHADLGNDQREREERREPNKQFAAHGGEVLGNVAEKEEGLNMVATPSDGPAEYTETLDKNMGLETSLLDDANI